MPQENDTHQKVRFGRDDHLDLNRLPSASTHQNRRALSRGVGVLHRVSKAILLAFCAVVVVVGILAAVLATSGISNTYFSSLAQSSVQNLAGPDIIAEIDDAGLSLDGTGNLAFQAKGVTFSKTSDKAELANIGSLRMGLKALPLLLGRVEIARIEIDDVFLSRGGDPKQVLAVLEQLKRGDGLYKPGAFPRVVNQFVAALRNQFEAKNLNNVFVTNVRLAPSVNMPTSMPRIETLTLAKNKTDEIEISGKVSQGIQKLEVVGLVDTSGFEFAVKGLSFGALTSMQSDADLDDSTSPISPNAIGGATLRGLQIDTVPALQLELNIERFDFRNRRGARILGDAKIRAELIENVDKVEIQSSRITVGSNTSVFTGAIGPEIINQGSKPAYRFEFVSNDTNLSPRDSPEKRISASVRIAGSASANGREVGFTQIGVRTLTGQLFGQGNVKFDAGSPEMIFSIDIPEISIADAKQLWPSIFAGGARLWVLDHVYGGTLTDSTISVAYRAGSLWPRSANEPLPLPTAEQVSADFTVNNARFDVIGDLPPVHDADGVVSVRGANTVIKLKKGTAYLDDGKAVGVTNGTMTIPVTAGKPVIADVNIDVSGDAASMAVLANKEPIYALSKAPISAADLSGKAIAHIAASFPLRKADKGAGTKWNAEVEFKDLSIAKEFSGQKLTDANGTLVVTKSLATFNAKGRLNGVPAMLVVVEPLSNEGGKRDVTAKLTLDDKARAKIAPGLKDILTGPVEVNLSGAGGNQVLTADLTKATLSLPWAGWVKGAGIPAQATFEMVKSERGTSIKDLVVKGKSFSISGNVDLVGGTLSKAIFSNVSLNKGDKVAVGIVNGKDGYEVSVSGDTLDLRALLKRVSGSFEKTAAATGGVPIRVKANISSVSGFNDEELRSLVASYSGKGSTVRSFTASANSRSGGNIAIDNTSNGDKRTVAIQTSDGGALLRFMDIYDKMLGGSVSIGLTAKGDGPLVGEVDAINFTIVGEPRLKSLVGAPASPDGQSLSKVTKNKLEVSKVKFERGNALIEKGKGYLKLAKGILRSEQIGLSYSGTLYNARGGIDMVGTFMPAFGLNRLFSELPIFGDLLGNGRDKGLIGITFKLAGNAKAPDLTVNPISLIAPGIFRQIFEFQ